MSEHIYTIHPYQDPRLDTVARSFVLIVDAFCRARGVSVSAASHLLFRRGTTLSEILQGKRCLRSDVMSSALQIMSDGWPPGSKIRWPQVDLRPPSVEVSTSRKRQAA